MSAAWRAVWRPGPPAPGGIAADDKESSCLIDVSIPDAQTPSVCPVVGMLDSGAGVTALSAGVLRSKLRRLFLAFPSSRTPLLYHTP